MFLSTIYEAVKKVYYLRTKCDVERNILLPSNKSGNTITATAHSATFLLKVRV